ncbi:MAG: EAL domain-containing protein, partial [Gammaproteobacteria bacterium]|nr:EAL domain-containing protein [Gammaproteobacteria bacterium]
EFIKTTLQQSKCKPEWIAFEITESQIMKNPDKAVSLLVEISKLGIEIAVDDFGTGYSSLTYLKRLPVDKLKIDRAFINELPHDDEDVAIVRAIIALSKSLKLSVIAEGVENQQQVDFLMAEGCPEIQGFFFAKPMSADKIEALLNS